MEDRLEARIRVPGLAQSHAYVRQHKTPRPRAQESVDVEAPQQVDGPGEVGDVFVEDGLVELVRVRRRAAIAAAQAMASSASSSIMGQTVTPIDTSASSNG